MISKNHKKHTDLARPSFGKFSRNEWAFVGGQCIDIKSLADDIIQILAPQYKCWYADARHPGDEDSPVLPPHLVRGAAASYTNHIDFHQFNLLQPFNHFQFRNICNEADLVLVNGNHFEAKAQVVIIDATKEASLKKRVSQLTNVELVLLAGNVHEVFDWLKEALPSWKQLPVYKLSDSAKIIDFFRKKLMQAIPPLRGLVLAGGKSLRMGRDKGLIKWYGREQKYYLADLLTNVCGEVFISCRHGQETNPSYRPLCDTFTGLGPYGAILSAFREQPNAAWLVIACDLPLVDLPTLQYLKEQRNPFSMATAFESPYNHFPEPLVTIWEPKSYPYLLSLLSQGYNCPVKALRNMDAHILQPQDPEVFTNVNTPEEMERIQQVLDKK